ncbi:hypothetical protein PHYSODRAFT_331734 [Phytophthora sojae]|uniref:Uncharacterized protein n=1 Tax=Phytophthora sojae (strain P6497) TaxID=1094619 RepID=G4ZCS2_PHYSP|nr:hypothetical protein PHYSODRAFT_331734 [Phytophthora sojae]EGZ17804.1 hypothetical protein PHYSODRAFT_331734 [Phytophthora sojae]|eukprot:XP_009526862.1 hypothetical protein PHYSODRAFT_331734 [Phytophthora sojae]
MLLLKVRKSVKHVDALLADVKLMATLEPARSVPFAGMAWDSLTDLCAVSEIMEGGDLRALLSVCENTTGFELSKLTIARNAAYVLTLETNLTAKREDDEMTASVGMSQWMALEVVYHKVYEVAII